MTKRKEKKRNRKKDYIIKGITERNRPSVTGGDDLFYWANTTRIDEDLLTNIIESHHT